MKRCPPFSVPARLAVGQSVRLVARLAVRLLSGLAPGLCVRLSVRAAIRLVVGLAVRLLSTLVAMLLWLGIAVIAILIDRRYIQLTGAVTVDVPEHSQCVQ